MIASFQKSLTKFFEIPGNSRREFSNSREFPPGIVGMADSREFPVALVKTLQVLPFSAGAVTPPA